jgi:hypothetical protein
MRGTVVSVITLRCNTCHQTFAEEEAFDDCCPFCGCDSLFEKEEEEISECEERSNA